MKRQSRNEYLEALGIPDFLYSKIDPSIEATSLSNFMLIEYSQESSFCEPGESQDLLVKMLASIQLGLSNVEIK